MKNEKKLRERRNPFDSEVLKEMNSFKMTFMLNLAKWALAALVFAFIIFCIYLLEVATSYLSPTYLSPNLDNFYSYFSLLNPIFQVIIGVVLAVVIMALVTTAVDIYEKY